MFFLRVYVRILLVVVAAGGISETVGGHINQVIDIFNPKDKPKKERSVVGPGEIVQVFLGGEVPSLEKYTRLQIRLEDFAEEAGLYRGSEENDTDIRKRLLQKPEVKNVIEECNKFRSPIDCNNIHTTLYRTPDGTCNNLQHPLWGSANYHNDRFLPACYEGIRGFRKSIHGGDLPTPRNITLQMKNKELLSNHVSAFYSFYGQTLVHDVTLAPATSVDGLPTPCCDYEPGYEMFINTSICENIYFDEDDLFYGKFGFNCMPFGRTAPYTSCTLDQKRVQFNKKTAYLDLSIIYGSDENEAKLMRTNDGSGRLNSTVSDKGEVLLPEAVSNVTLFCPINKTSTCFLSGDERVNQHTNLMSLQTMYVRLHNIYSNILKKLNPHWDGDRIYQETRRLVVAIQQFMAYNEYIPWLVGPKNVNKYNLSVDSNSAYDANMSATILSEFSTASFRLHSMVPKNIGTKKRFDETYSYVKPLHKGKLANYVIESCEVASEKNDRFIKNDVKGFLYRPPGADFGTDLPAANIQRGRDHGLPPYHKVLEKCSGRKPIKDFFDLKDVMTLDNIKWLRKIYSCVFDVDLWIGMLLENHVKDGVTGPTAACISSIQFHRIKFGDSFFFTHTIGRYPFTADQLNFIRSYSLSRWICETTGYYTVREHPLLLPSVSNKLISCATHPSLDVNVWKDKSN